MTVKKVLCDTCRSEGALPVSYFVERNMDAAGSMDNEYETIDLCGLHAVALLNELLHRKAAAIEIARYVPIVRKMKKVFVDFPTVSC